MILKRSAAVLIPALFTLFPLLSPARFLTQNELIDATNEFQGLREFPCRHEKIATTISPAVDGLYQYAHYRESTVKTPKVPGDMFRELARYYRIAGAHGKTEAKLALFSLLARYDDKELYYQEFDEDLDEDEIARKLRLIADEREEVLHWLLDNQISVGYAEMAGRLSGSDHDRLAYHYIAAKLGNSRSQSILAAMVDKDLGFGDRYMTVKYFKNKYIIKTLGKSLYTCVAQSGDYPDAVTTVVRYNTREGNYDGALPALQQAINDGSVFAALDMKGMFTVGVPPAGNFPGIQPDRERAARYELYRMLLITNTYQPVVIPDVNQTIPLPPAPLPPFPMQEPHDPRFPRMAEVPRPEIPVPPVAEPAESVITRLAQEKNLAPGTGLPATPR